MNQLSLGISPCPNDVFIFAGILLGDVDTCGLAFRVDYQDVETLNRGAQNQTYDVAKISYANYPHCESCYELLETGGALGRGCGPLLLAHGEPWSFDRTTMVPGEFTTANFLLDFFTRAPIPKRFLPFDALYNELVSTPGTQGVVIHEKRFTYEADGLDLVCDLGAHWERETGYPIPLGAIVTRRDLAIGHAMSHAIRSSIAWAYRNFAAAFSLCREYAADLDPEVVKAHIDLYVNGYSMDLGSDGRAAVTFFLQELARRRGNRSFDGSPSQ